MLHISESDAGGGAGKAARVLHEGLRARGLDSRMLVGRRLGADEHVRSIKRNAVWRAADRVSGTAMDRLSLQYLFYPSSYAVAWDPWFRRADILQLHNLHGSFFSFPALRLLARLRPTVWWMQDMWPLTGHVAYSFDCERWRHGCGDCPYLKEYPALRADRSAFLWRSKRRVYAKIRPTLVVSSRWLAGLAAASPLVGHFDQRVIPGGVDVERFSPRPRSEALAELGVDGGRRTVLVFDGEARKGAAILGEVAERLAAGGTEATLLVAGDYGGWRAPAPLDLVELGTIRDERRLAAAYAAADVFLFPTLADNLPNAMLESLASGTPLVSTAVGGIPDAVSHLENGYLARGGDADDLARGVRLLLGDPERLAAMRAEARRRAEEQFDERLQSGRFLELYEEVRDAAGDAG